MAEQLTGGVTPITGQTLAAAEVSSGASAAAEETNKTLTGVNSIIINLEELQREYYTDAEDFFDSAEEVFGSILDSLVSLTTTVVSTTEEDKKAANKKPKAISKAITIDQVIQYNDSSAAAAVLLCNKLDSLFGKGKKKESGGSGGIEKLLQAAGAGAPALLAIAGAMLLFAVGAAIFDKVSWPAALAGVAFFAVFVAGVLAISIALKKEAKNLKQFALNVLMMTAALALFAATVWFISKVNDNVDWGAVLATLAAFTGFVLGVALLAKLVDSQKSDFQKFAIGTLIMVAALAMFTGVMLLMGWAYDNIDFTAAGIITGLFLVFVLGIALLAKLANSNMSEFMKFGITVAIMTGDLMLFALALAEIQALNLLENITSVLGTLALFIGFIVLLAIIATIANANMAQFAMFALVSLLMIGSLMLFTLAIKFAATVSVEDILMGLAVIGAMALFIVAVVALGFILMATAPIVFLGLGTAMVVGLLVLGVVALYYGITELIMKLEINEAAFDKLYSIETLIGVIANIDWHPFKMLKAMFKMGPAFAAIAMVAVMVACLGAISKLEIDTGKIKSVMNIVQGLIATLGDYAEKIKDLGIKSAIALGIALGGITEAMLNITEVIKRLRWITPEEVNLATANLQYIMSKLFVAGDDPVNAPTLMDVLESVPGISKSAARACGALPDVTAALNNIADVILKVRSMSPEEVAVAVQSVLAMADCLANCSGFFKSIAENSEYGGFLGFGKKDTFKVVNEKMDTISGILNKIIKVFNGLEGVDPAGIMAIADIFEQISHIDKSFVTKSEYFANGLDYIATAKIRSVVYAFNGLNPSSIPLAEFISQLKPVERISPMFPLGAKLLKSGVNSLAESKFKQLKNFRIAIDEIHPQPFMRLAVAMDKVIHNASGLRLVNKELARLADYLDDVNVASKKFNKTFSIGSITSNAIDKAQSWLKSFTKKNEDGNSEKDSNSYLASYLEDGNVMVKQIFDLMSKWEEQGIAIRDGEPVATEDTSPAEAAEE